MAVVRWLAATLILFAAMQSAPRAETPVGSTISDEVFLYMKVNPVAAQALLPDGWTLKPWSKGAWAGANLLIILGETHSDFDGKRKPRRDAGHLNMRMFTWGSNDTVKWRIFQTHSYATDDLRPSQANSRNIARIERTVSRKSRSMRHAAISEDWEIFSGDGLLQLTMTYDARTPRFSTQKGKVSNPDDPDGDRVSFRIEQLSYMIHGLGREGILHSVSLTNSIPALMPLLDGTEEILSIRILPLKMTERFRP